MGKYPHRRTQVDLHTWVELRLSLHLVEEEVYADIAHVVRPSQGLGEVLPMEVDEFTKCLLPEVLRESLP